MNRYEDREILTSREHTSRFKKPCRYSEHTEARWVRRKVRLFASTSCARAINLSRCRIERLMDIRGRCVRTVITADLWACVHLVNSRELPRKRWGEGVGPRRQVSREPDWYTDDPRVNHENLRVKPARLPFRFSLAIQLKCFFRSWNPSWKCNTSVQPVAFRFRGREVERGSRSRQVERGYVAEYHL